MDLEQILAIMVGVALSATCGFRVFVPLLVMSISAHTGHLPEGVGFEWIGSTPALILLGTATLLEVGAYYIPWLDNLMDTVATPAAVVAGTVITASVIGDVSPMLKWAMALIAGGGAAGGVQGTTVLLRGASTATTGGIGNPVVSTAELGAAGVGAVVALFFPILVIIALVIGLIVAIRLIKKWRNRGRLQSG